MRFILLLVLFQLIVTSLFSQDFLNSPYLNAGLFMLPGNGSANVFNKKENIADGFEMGVGYEFRIRENAGLAMGVDYMFCSFEDDAYVDIQKVAQLRIGLNAFSFNLSPRYYLVFEDESALSLGLIARMESSAAKADLQFRDEEDFSLDRVNSGFQFQYGFGLGYSFPLKGNVSTRVALNFVSRDYGSSINKLDLERSGYFKNEIMKRTTSVELELTLSFPGIHKKRK